ncbi:MAG TPA: hypothetical protein DHV02_04890, partial [Neisseriales bacterium]|nr:hypothetical protein [Neisseriales bacterium]
IFSLLLGGVDDSGLKEALAILSDDEFNGVKDLISKIVSNKTQLAKRGWFISDIIFRDILEFHMLIESLTINSVDDLEILLKKLIVSNLGCIQKQLIEFLPNRQSIINDLFYAHNNHKFSLSTAVFLSQADGVAHDLGGENIFHLPKPSSNGLQEFLNQQNQSYISLMKNIIYSFDTDSNSFNKIKADVDLFKSERKRESDFKGLNRHLVLHGIDVNYGTEENSLKALSFLCCMCSLFSKRINEFEYLNDE